MNSVAMEIGIVIISNLHNFYTGFSSMWIIFVFMSPLLCYYNQRQILIKTVKTETKHSYQQTEIKQTGIGYMTEFCGWLTHRGLEIVWTLIEESRDL